MSLEIVRNKDNVTVLCQYTSLDIPVERVTRAAEENCLKVVIFGYDKDGNEYFASSFGDKLEMVWLIEHFKFKLLNGDFDV